MEERTENILKQMIMGIRVFWDVAGVGVRVDGVGSTRTKLNRRGHSHDQRKKLDKIKIITKWYNLVALKTIFNHLCFIKGIVLH